MEPTQIEVIGEFAVISNERKERVYKGWKDENGIAHTSEIFDGFYLHCWNDQSHITFKTMKQLPFKPNDVIELVLRKAPHAQPSQPPIE